MYILSTLREDVQSITEEFENENFGTVRIKLKQLQTILDKLPLESIAVPNKGEEMKRIYDIHKDKYPSRDE